MGDLSPHFNKKEFACKDCGESNINMDLVFALEQLRDIVQKPIIVHSAYRCPEKNAAVGGVSQSQHMLGNAADINIPGLTVQEMYDAAMQVPAFKGGGIGVYDTNFIHVDVRHNIARWARVDGKYVGLGEIVKV